MFCDVLDAEASHAELQRVLLLVLGCAVQSDEREQFIENIRRLDVDIQRAIVDAIQQVDICCNAASQSVHVLRPHLCLDVHPYIRACIYNMQQSSIARIRGARLSLDGKG